MQRARQSPVYNPFVDGLGDSYNAWNDTTLDPAYNPSALPQPDTLDGSLMESWYSSSHIYSAVFIESLPQFIPTNLLEPSENVLGDDACDELHSAQHDSLDSLEDEQSFSRRMHGEKLEGHPQGFEAVYMHAVRCTEALKREMVDDFDWSKLRNFVACALSLGPEAGSDDSEPAVAVQEHSMHSIPDAEERLLRHDLLPAAGASQKPKGHGEDEEAPSELQTHMHADAYANHIHVCGRKPLVEVTLMVNETAKHAVPYALNAANNAALRALAGKGFMANNTLSVTLMAFPVLPTEQWVHILSFSLYLVLVCCCCYSRILYACLVRKQRYSGGLVNCYIPLHNNNSFHLLICVAFAFVGVIEPV